MPGRALIEAVDQLARRTLDGTVVRCVAPGYLPLSGEGARVHGGRWNPPGSFAVLYAAFDRPTMLAELERAARRQGLTTEDLLPRDEVTYSVGLLRVLDLTEPANLAAVGLSKADLLSPDWSRCQEVGDAAHYVGFEAVLAPSAAGSGETLAVFLDRLVAGSRIETTGSRSLTA